MRLKPVACIVAAISVVFISGVAVGQRTPASKFAKYLRPVVHDDMHLITLEVNIESIRENVPLNDGISIPQVFFNYREDHPQASANISVEFEKAPLDEVKGKITDKYYSTYYGLKNYIPELSEDDFVLRVNRYTTDSAHKLFAECKHGSIIFH